MLKKYSYTGMSLPKPIADIQELTYMTNMEEFVNCGKIEKLKQEMVEIR